ncbi:MAG: single-stranded-DNA-specific exonuclease RecJ [Planctomycetes bacterium]|nr:single-stranded-DNA-specific exonuclease RecJ [Planctomycetota bacterium]
MSPHDEAAIERLALGLRVPPIVAHLLLNRGLHRPEVARRFLEAPLTGLHPPELLPGLAQAADRLHAVVRAGRRVCVYGDYDVDGLTGTAILLQTLRLLGTPVDFYVPHRLEEGYGLNLEALSQVARSGASLVITVDCGIASLAEAREARRLGLELIITDHHQPKDSLPEADVVVHPRLPGSSYPFDGLSGSGVAFKLAWALCQRVSGGEKVTPRFRDFLVDSVVLAALGMVADVMPLHDENRIFVRHGLARLARAPSLGLKTLLEAAGLGSKTDLRASDISFSLAPRLNAAGRLGCARLVIDLLTCTSKEKAADLARYLEDQNQKRQFIERRILAEASAMVDRDGLHQAPALVLASPEWHPGVIGIVAGRLVEQYARPVLLIALAGNPPVGQGSGRSVPGFALHEALGACADGLLSHGGHAAAAGFRLPPAHLDGFRERFCAYAGRHFTGGPVAPRLLLDAEIPLGLLTPGLVEALNQLEPYGAGNPRPLFLAGPLQVVGEPRRVGRGERHLQFRVRQQQSTFKAIAFNLAERVEELMSAGGQCCLAFTPSFNDWQGYRSIQLEVRDFQPGPQARLA